MLSCVLPISFVNPKLFGAIVLVGASIGGCRTGILGPPDLVAVADLSSRDSLVTLNVDMAQPVDMLPDELHACCVTGSPGEQPDLSGCIPITCILL